MQNTAQKGPAGLHTSKVEHVNPNPAADIRPFGMKDKLGYMFGDFANDFFFILISSFLMVFYTNVLGINPTIIGVLFVVARCFDAFTDVGMGQLVDRAKPNPYGRYRIWIKRMKLFAVVAGLLVFVPWVADLPYGVRVAYIFVTYILWGSFAYTSVNIPYGSMAAAMTDVPQERSALSTFRSIGASLAGALIGVVTPLLVYDTLANGAQVLNGTKLFMVACVFAVAAYILYTLCHTWCVERVASLEVTEKQSFGKLIKALATNRPLLAIIASAIISLLSMMVAQSLNMYLYMDYFQNIQAMSVASFLGTGTALIVAPFAPKLAAKYGKKEICSIGLLLAAAVYAILFFAKITNPWIFCGFLLLGNIGASVFTLLVWAFISDVIDYQTVKTGDADGGTIYGVYSFARKIGQAAAGGLGASVIGMIGYVTSTGSEVVTQTPEVTSAIYAWATGVPAVGYLALALVLMFFYPLGKKKMEEITAQMKAMNQSAEVELEEELEAETH